MEIGQLVAPRVHAGTQRRQRHLGRDERLLDRAGSRQLGERAPGVGRRDLDLPPPGTAVAGAGRQVPDAVLEFSTYINAGTMQRRRERFFAHPGARQLYDERRAIDSHTVDLAALARLPDGTLGRAYATFLSSRGLTPEVFDAPPAEVRDPRARYVIQRLRQTHDLWHVVTGHDTDFAGEIALQAFTFAQVRAPSALVLGAVGTLKAVRQRPSLPREVAAAFRRGRRAEPLAAFAWEDHWATPLVEVRAMLGLSGAPCRAAA